MMSQDYIVSSRRRAQMARVVLWCWRLSFVSVSVVAVAMTWRASLLKDRIDALERVVSIQDEWCDGLSRVNDVCEASFREVAQRLGLDDKWMPLVNTALWKRAAGEKTIAQARRQLGASRWQKDEPMGEVTR